MAVLNICILMKIFCLICAIIYTCFSCVDYVGIRDSWFIPITLLLYVVMNCLYLRLYRKKQLFCFEFFFSISFFLCSFLTPFILPLLDSYESRTFVTTISNQIRVYILSFLGYCFYMLGLIAFKDEKKNRGIWFNVSFSSQNSFVSNILCFISISMFYATGGVRLLTLYSNLASDLTDRYGNWGEFMIYSVYLYSISIVVNLTAIGKVASSLRMLLKKMPRLFYLNTILLLFPLLLSGLRSVSVQLLIPLLMMYSIMVKRIKFKYVLGIILLGYFLLVLIGTTRHGNGMIEKDSIFLTLVSDFVSANGANSFLVDYTDSHGITGGSNMILPVASIVPFLQSVILLFVDKNELSLSSSSVFTRTFMDSSQGGLGTGLIGDIYYTFGTIGVIVLMYLLGFSIRKLTNAHNSPYALAALMTVSGNAIFAPRVEYCYILRSVSYTVIFLFIIIIILGRKNEYSLCNR